MNDDHTYYTCVYEIQDKVCFRECKINVYCIHHNDDVVMIIF